MIEKLTKALIKLYPSGHAFRLFKNPWKNLNIALLEEGNRIIIFSRKVRDSGIPGQLPSEALSDWEELFQLKESASLTDEERNQRIKSRFNAVGGQGKDYLQDVLNDAFKLLLGEYRIYVVRCGDSISTCGNPISTCGSYIESPTTAEIVIYENNPPWSNPYLLLGTLIYKTDNDNPADIPADLDYWGVFWFISGPDGLGSFLEIPISRKNEFIETVLRHKPVDSWVVAQVNFV
jgi:hypothetical protein